MHAAPQGNSADSKKIDRMQAEMRALNAAVMAYISHSPNAQSANPPVDAIVQQIAPQIAKSILFRRQSDGAPVLVVASGVNRVDEKKRPHTVSVGRRGHNGVTLLGDSAGSLGLSGASSGNRLMMT